MEENTKLSDNSEIQEALKEFEAKADTNQAMQNGDVLNFPKKEVDGMKFETDTYKAVKFYNETKTPKIVKFIMKNSGGLIQEEKYANYILLGIVALCVGVSIYLFWISITTPEPSPEVLEQMMQTLPPSLNN